MSALVPRARPPASGCSGARIDGARQEDGAHIDARVQRRELAPAYEGCRGVTRSSAGADRRRRRLAAASRGVLRGGKRAGGYHQTLPGLATCCQPTYHPSETKEMRMSHVEPSERQDAPRGDAPPKPEPVPDHPTPTSDDPDTGQRSDEQAASEATRESDDNPNN